MVMKKRDQGKYWSRARVSPSVIAERLTHGRALLELERTSPRSWQAYLRRYRLDLDDAREWMRVAKRFGSPDRERCAVVELEIPYRVLLALSSAMYADSVIEQFLVLLQTRGMIRPSMKVCDGILHEVLEGVGGLEPDDDEPEQIPLPLPPMVSQERLLLLQTLAESLQVFQETLHQLLAG